MTNKRVVLITGGMGGLGEPICQKLHKLGHEVIVGYRRSQEKAQAWQEQMKQKGFDLKIISVDVCDFSSCQQCVSFIEKEWELPVDVLINNAGITRDVTFRRMTLEQWQDVISTNLDSVFNMTKQVIDGMLARQWGRIINISSVNGQKGAFGQTNYAAAKAGIHGFTKSLALEVAQKGITVNTVSPGYIATPMVTEIDNEILESKILPHIPMRRLGLPEEIAALMCYLISDESAFMTGANIAINGGQHMA